MDLRVAGKVFIVTGATVSSLAADITERDTARQVVEFVLDRHDRLDGLVNNVGGLDTRSSFLDVTDDQWLATFELRPPSRRSSSGESV